MSAGGAAGHEQKQSTRPEPPRALRPTLPGKIDHYSCRGDEEESIDQGVKKEPCSWQSRVQQVRSQVHADRHVGVKVISNEGSQLAQTRTHGYAQDNGYGGVAAPDQA